MCANITRTAGSCNYALVKEVGRCPYLASYPGSRWAGYEATSSMLMSCVSEPDYKEEQSSELETLRCIYTDEELTGTHCVARLHTAACEQLH